MISFCTYRIRALFQRSGIYNTLIEILPIDFEKRDVLIDG